MSDDRGAGKVTQVREWVQLVVFVLATGWGAWTFVFKDILTPARRPTAIEVTPSLEEIGQYQEYRLIRIRIVCLNPTDRRIYVPALWYSVWGHQIAKRDTAGFSGEVQSAPLSTVTARHTKDIKTEVVAAGRVFAGDYPVWWDPKDKTNYEYAFAVPAKLYDFLELTVQYYMTKDTAGMKPPRWEQQEDASWLPIFTMRAQYGDSAEIFDPLNSRHRAWERANQVGHSQSGAILSLWPGPQSR